MVSDRIANPLREVSQRQWTVLAARGILQTLVVALGVLLAASLLLGYLPGIWMPLRIAVAALVWVVVIYESYKSLRPALARWSLSAAAQHAEQMLPDAQERLSSAVELSQTDDAFRGSPELVDHLLDQAEQDAGRVRASAVVPYSSITRWTIYFLPVLAIWAALMFNPHTAGKLLRGLFSVLTPWQAVPESLADISVKPGDQTLAEGDPLSIVATVNVDEGKPARSATLVRTFATGQSISQSLEQVAARQFRLNLDGLAQSFKYKVVSDRGESQTYTVTVNPRPAIARLDVHYEFPAYTHLEPRNFTASDGNVEAVVATKVTLSLHTTGSLVADKSQLVFDEGKPTQAVIPLAATAGENVYEAKFPVTQSGEYQIRLLNNYNLGNKAELPRVVTAIPDEPPTIAIVSPKEQITVRPDDDVPVLYVASDDFGVAHIEALVQVDDGNERTAPVTIHARDHRNIKDTWTLSVSEILRLAGTADATRISYQLKATDTRDPDPQTGLSARQTLLISKNESRSFEDKLNEMRKQDLMAAIRKAIERLNRDQAPVAEMRDALSRAALREDQTRLATDVRDRLTLTGKDLSAAASDYLQTPFAEVAKAAGDIADNQIAHAADNTAKMALDAADLSAGHADGALAYTQIIDARDSLEKLLRKVEEAQQKAEAASELKQAAREQQQVAKEMADHPEKQEENRQKQQEAINKLQDAMRKDPTLQNQQAREMAAKLTELENKIEQEEKKQTELQNQTQKQEEKQQAQEAANALAQEQKKLNEEVKQFAKKDQKPLEQAHAQAPAENQQQDLVKNIEKNNLQQAAQEAKQQADQLKQDAQQLKQEANNAAIPPTADQQKQQQQDQQNQQQAADAQRQADQAARDVKNQAQKAKPDQPNNDAAKQAAQEAQKAAEQIQQQADKVEQQNQQGANADDVKKDADAAKADAQQAAADAQQAADANNPADAQQAADKAAQELAKAANELKQAAQAEAKADKQAAQQQNQQAAAHAADQAQALADQQQQIAKALQQEAQQAADAQAAGGADPQQNAQQQQQLADQTQQEKQAAQQLGQQAQAQKDAALAQRADAAAKALDQAQADQQQAAKADADAKPADAAQAQADAQQQLAKAEAALRGQPDPAQAQASADPAQGQPDQGQGQPDQGKGQDPGQGQPDQGKGQDQGQGQPQQTAAQAAQEAAAAQQQSEQHADPAAAAEAAQALAQAAQAAQQGLPGQPEAGQPEQGTEPGTDPGQDTGPTPGHTPDSKQGIAGVDQGGNNQPPASVQALGISASDWAKLPPLMQKELMTASQQSGPPAYKQMIKNYYIRLAKIQENK